RPQNRISGPITGPGTARPKPREVNSPAIWHSSNIVSPRTATMPGECRGASAVVAVVAGQASARALARANTDEKAHGPRHGPFIRQTTRKMRETRTPSDAPSEAG